MIPSKYHFANYPQFIYYDKSGRAWQTNSEGRALGVARNGKRLVELRLMVESTQRPLSSMLFVYGIMKYG